MLKDTIVMGSDHYENKEQVAANAAEGRPNLGLGRNCHITGAIIDKNARIGDGCVLSPAGKPDGVYVDGLVIIRDGVLVVTKGAIVPAGTTL